MDEKFYELFGIELTFSKGFVFALVLNILNTTIITMCLEVSDTISFLLSLVMLTIETILYLGWKYLHHKRNQ